MYIIRTLEICLIKTSEVKTVNDARTSQIISYSGRANRAIPQQFGFSAMLTTIIRPRRSLIFVPGNKPEWFPKALKYNADIVCVDLEDAIAPNQKDAARETTLALFDKYEKEFQAECVVRINNLRSADGLRDVMGVLARKRPPPALMLTKVKSSDEVSQLEELLKAPPHDSIRFHVIIETNDGLEAAYQIAQSSGRIDSLLFGGVDMSAELRTNLDWENLLYARSRLVHAAAGAGIDLIDVPSLDLEDIEGLENAARASAGLGFTGKAAIHPKQVPVINTCFSPSAEAIAEAQKIVEAFENSEDGLVVVDGKLLEKPVLRSMHRILAIADRIR